MKMRLHVLSSLVGSAVSCSIKDWSSACPAGWEETYEGHCVAPLSYGGPCQMLLDFGLDATVEAKQEFEASCHAQWPCGDSCEKEYSHACPLGWAENEDGWCVAPMTYRGECVRKIRFETQKDKSEFESDCDVEWPCRRNCEEDFRQACPSGWANVDGVCVAGQRGATRYTGPCVPFADVAKLSQNDKKRFAAACMVDFCAEEQAQILENDCGDFQTCPSGWLRVGSNSDEVHCYGVKYKGDCRPLVAVSEIEEIGRGAFMEQCGVVFDCAGLIPRTKDMEVTRNPRPAARSVSGPIDGKGRVVGVPTV